MSKALVYGSLFYTEQSFLLPLHFCEQLVALRIFLCVFCLLICDKGNLGLILEIISYTTIQGCVFLNSLWFLVNLFFWIKKALLFFQNLKNLFISQLGVCRLLHYVGTTLEGSHGSLLLSETIKNWGSMVWYLYLLWVRKASISSSFSLVFFSSVDSFPKFSVFNRFLSCPWKTSQSPCLYWFKSVWNFAISYLQIGFCPLFGEWCVLEGLPSLDNLMKECSPCGEECEKKICPKYFILWSKKKDYLLCLPLVLLAGDCF